jgi:cell filamentation protein
MAEYSPILLNAFGSSKIYIYYVKSKYLLFSHKTAHGRDFKYWYVTDKAFFEAEKPNYGLAKLSDIWNRDIEKPIIENIWQNWETNDVQRIVSKTNEVCINYLATTDEKEIQKFEDLKLLELYDFLVHNFDISKAFGFKTVQEWHSQIFGELYPFAGELRSVEISKGIGVEEWTWRLEFLSGLPELDKKIKKASRTKYKNIDEIVGSLAEVISDFLFIHPFREGNGRVSRLIGDMILAKNGLPMIGLDLKSSDNYIEKVHEGYAKNYEPLAQLLKEKIILKLEPE